MTNLKWIDRYAVDSIGPNWANKSKNRYPSEFGNRLPYEIRIENLITDQPFTFDSSESILSGIPDYDDINKAIVLLFVFDLVNDFCSSIPKTDSGIYKTYNELSSKPDIETIPDFPTFYTFVRKVQSTNITNLTKYTVFEKTVEKYTFDVFPLPGSKWRIPYNGGVIDVIVDGPEYNHQDKKSLIDIPRSCVVEDIKLKPKQPLNIGDNITVPPKKFNDGQNKNRI